MVPATDLPLITVQTRLPITPTLENCDAEDLLLMANTMSDDDLYAQLAKVHEAQERSVHARRSFAGVQEQITARLEEAERTTARGYAALEARLCILKGMQQTLKLVGTRIDTVQSAVAHLNEGVTACATNTGSARAELDQLRQLLTQAVGRLDRLEPAVHNVFVPSARQCMDGVAELREAHKRATHVMTYHTQVIELMKPLRTFVSAAWGGTCMLHAHLTNTCQGNAASPPPLPCVPALPRIPTFDVPPPKYNPQLAAPHAPLPRPLTRM